MDDETPRTRRLGRRLAIAGGLVLAALGLVPLGLYGVAQTGPGRAWIAKTAAAALSVPGEAEISIERLEGRLPQRILLSGVSVRDRSGRWLRAAQIALEWRPLALLSRELHVTTLRVVDLAVERPPAETGTGPEDRPAGVPSLPVDVTVDRLSVEDVRLGAAVLGEAASFRVAGEAALTDVDRFTSSLVVERTDGVYGRLELTSVYRSAEDRLSLEARLAEPAGGLIARALDAPELPALRVEVAGEGPLDRWAASVTGALEGLASLEADVAVERRADEALGFRVDGVTSVLRPLGELPANLFAGEQAFEIAGAWRGDRVLAVDRVRIEAAPGRLEADGTLSMATLELDARARVDLTDPSLPEAFLPGVALEGPTVEARLAGALPRPKIDATLAAARLVVPGVEAQGATARLAFEPAPGSGNLRGRISADGAFDELAVDDLRDIQGLLGRSLAWRVAGPLDLERLVFEAEDLALESGPTRLAGRGNFDLAEGRFRSDLHATFADLAGLGPLIGFGVQGRGEIDARVEVDGFGERIAAGLSGDLRETRLDEPLLQALLTDRASIAANLAYAPGQPFGLSGIEVETPAARVIGDASFLDGFERLDGRYALALAEAAALSGPLGVGLSGQARVDGVIAGRLANPELEGRLAWTAARLEGVDLGRLDLAFSAADLAAGPRGRLELTATPSFGQLDASSDYVFADAELRLTGLDLRGLDARARGGLTLPSDGGPLSGALDIRAADLAPWLRLADLDGAGSATATLRLSGDGPRQAGRLELEATELALAFGGESPLTARSLRLEFESSDLMGSRAGTAEISAAGVGLGALRLDAVDATAEGHPADAAFRLETNGSFRGPLALEAAGRLRRGPEELRLEVASATGQAFGQALRLQQPVAMARRAEGLELDGLDLAFGEARLVGRTDLGPERIAVDLEVRALALASLAPFLPTAGVSGTAAGEISIEGPRDNLSGTARVTLSDVRFELIREGPAFGLDASADWRDRRLAISGRLTGTPERNAELSADLPLQLAPDGMTPLLPPGEAISGRLSWHGAMASIWPLVPLNGHLLEGETDLAVELAGNVAAPRVTGSLRLGDGRYESLDSGTIVEDLDLRIGFAEDRAELSALTGNDGGAGALTASGEIAFDEARGHPFELRAQMTEFAGIRRDDIVAITDGQLQFAGSIERATLTGRFETRSVEIRIVDRLPANVVTLEVTETDADGEVVEPAGDEKAGSAGPEIGLDVAVAMPRRVFVRGRGLDSEWSGNLKVGGTADAPAIEGELSLVRGQLSVLAKPFRLTSGSVRFPGGAEVMPELDVVAEHKAKDLLVTARVAGPATNPSIALSSVPELPQDEILSRVLFGKSRGQLSALEAAQLASGVAQLTGTGGGLGGLEFARSLLGVDRLAIGSTGSGDTAAPSVEAGKYVTDEVYIGVKKGVTDQSGAVGVEVEITPNISVESETGVTGESDIGVKFKWDY